MFFCSPRTRTIIVAAFILVIGQLMSVISRTHELNNTTTKGQHLDSHERRHEQSFNKDKRPSWLTGYRNRSMVEQSCNKSKPCFASDKVVPLCATDNHTYLNPGVLQCAQKCDKTLKVDEFGPCPGHVFPTVSSANTSVKQTPNESTEDQMSLKGILQKLLFG